MRQSDDLILQDLEQGLQVFFKPVNPNPIFVNKVKNNLARKPYTLLEPLQQRFYLTPVLIFFALITAILLILFRTKNLKG